MTEHQILETARRYRDLAEFYGHGVTKALSISSKEHYCRLGELCEARAFELECSIIGAPVTEGGPLDGQGVLPIVVV